jgi:hypothetical protein
MGPIKEVGLQVNTEKTKYMLLSHHQSAGQTHDIKTASRPFENVAQFKYLRMTTKQTLIQEEIKRSFNSDNAYYHSVQNPLSSCLSKNVKIQIYRTIILHVILHVCETWSQRLREEYRLRVSEENVLTEER